MAQCRLVYNPLSGQLECGGAAAGSAENANAFATCPGTTTTCTVTVTPLNLTTLDATIIQCWSPTTTVAVTNRTSTGTAPINSVTLTYASTANVTCKVNASGGRSSVYRPSRLPRTPGTHWVPGTHGPYGPNRSSWCHRLQWLPRCHRPSRTNRRGRPSRATGTPGSPGAVGPPGPTGSISSATTLTLKATNPPTSGSLRRFGQGLLQNRQQHL